MKSCFREINIYKCPQSKTKKIFLESLFRKHEGDIRLVHLSYIWIWKPSVVRVGLYSTFTYRVVLYILTDYSSYLNIILSLYTILAVGDFEVAIVSGIPRSLEFY